jgi:hypothetical protein
VPNLLSLDAPLVALVWLYVFAKTWRVLYHPWPIYLVLALVVWGIYVIDRLLDSALHGGKSELPLRHQFHRRLRVVLLPLAVLALLAALGMALVMLPREVFSYAMIVGVLVAGFFATALFTGGRSEIPYTKNLLAGLAFASGTAIGAHVYVPTVGVLDLIRSPEMLTFGVLCALNITAVDLWEHAERSSDPEVKSADDLSLTLPIALLAGLALFFATSAGEFVRPFYIAIMVGAGALYVVNRLRSRLPVPALRVLADVALLFPAAYFYLDHHDVLQGAFENLAGWFGGVTAET